MAPFFLELFGRLALACYRQPHTAQAKALSTYNNKAANSWLVLSKASTKLTQNRGSGYWAEAVVQRAPMAYNV